MCNCNPKCIYFPQSPSNIIKEYFDKNGVKRREGEFLCMFDDHRIMKFEKCNNYREINR